MCVPDLVKKINLRVFNLLLWKNQTKQIRLHESYKCVCKLNSRFCINKQRLNKEKCRCECKKLVKCNKRFIWNPNSCECEYKERAAYLLTKDCEEIIDKNNTLLIKKYNKYLKTLIIANHTLHHLFYFC